MSEASDFSWSEQVPYLCVCGTTYPVERQRWVDRDAEPELHARILIDGPLRGRCPRCSEPALGRTTWLEIVPSEAKATLVLGGHQRSELVAALKAHLDSIVHRSEATPGWLLQPRWRFEGGRNDESPSRQLAVSLIDEEGDSGAMTVSARKPEPDAAVPRPVGARRSTSTTASTRDAHVAPMTLEGDVPTVRVALEEGDRARWGSAALRVQPIHLRRYGYPLIGVRIVASYLGETSICDGIVDVADELANEIFTRLSNEVRVHIGLTDLEGNTPASREVSAPDLGRNAALCLESARGVLASEEFRPGAFASAWTRLSQEGAEARQKTAPHPLAPGDFMHLLTPRESWLALEALDAASDKSNLGQLLEVDGLPIGEFEAIRKRVLKAATEHGLCAPRRFWRRVMASGLAEGAPDYARQLASHRATWEAEDDDLDEDRQQAAWERIRGLCVRRDLPFPPELMDALGIEEASRPTRAGTGSKAAAGEIEVASDIENTPPPTHINGILEPQLPLEHGVAGLGEAGAMVSLSQAFGALDGAEGADMLALLPTLAGFGTQAVPALVSRLDSPRREVRQATLALLSLAPDPAAVRPLVTRLYGEDSKVWTDVARSLGSFGPRVLGPITAYLRDRPTPRPGDEAVLRAARAMAEVAVGDEEPGMAQDAVEALADAPQRAVSRAASRALATLHDVRQAKAQVLGHAPMPEVTQVRGFSRRIMDALGLAGPLARPQEQTQVIDLGEIMEVNEVSEELTELDPEEIESL